MARTMHRDEKTLYRAVIVAEHAPVEGHSEPKYRDGYTETYYLGPFYTKAATRGAITRERYDVGRRSWRGVTIVNSYIEQCSPTWEVST